MTDQTELKDKPYILYSIAGSSSTAITVLLESWGVDYEIIQRKDVFFYSDIVPTNQVPALVDGDFVLSEGSAIALYLMEKHCEWFATLEGKAKAQFYQRLMFNYATLHPTYSKLRMVSIQAEKNYKLIQELADRVSSLWEIVEANLGDNKFMFGDKCTIVDYSLTLYFYCYEKYIPEIEVQIGNKARELIERVKQSPEFIRALKKEGLIQ